MQQLWFSRTFTHSASPVALIVPKLFRTTVMCSKHSKMPGKSSENFRTCALALPVHLVHSNASRQLSRPVSPRIMLENRFCQKMWTIHEKCNNFGFFGLSRTPQVRLH